VKGRRVKGRKVKVKGGGDQRKHRASFACGDDFTIGAERGPSASVFDFARVLVRIKAAAALRAVARGLASLDPTCARLRSGRYVRVARACRKERHSMALQVAQLSIEVVEALRPLVPRIRRHDRSLADQLVRAASSVALNIAEGEHSDPGNRRARFYSAAGSANETLAALKVAVAWGYFAAAEAEVAAGMLRRVLAGLWKLTRG
jgi:four helix bundle protein